MKMESHKIDEAEMTRLNQVCSRAGRPRTNGKKNNNRSSLDDMINAVEGWSSSQNLLEQTAGLYITSDPGVSNAPTSEYTPPVQESTHQSQPAASSMTLYETGHRVEIGDILRDPTSSVSKVTGITESGIELHTPAMGKINVGPEYIQKCELLKRG